MQIMTKEERRRALAAAALARATRAERIARESYQRITKRSAIRRRGSWLLIAVAKEG